MEEINFDDWSKLDLRVGVIKDIEDIPGADKLYKLNVDIGDKKITLCSGLKEYYSTEELKGKKIVVFVNLSPRKMRGIESQGMLLAAVSEDEKKVVLIRPKLDVSAGEKIEFKK
ncbi:MAG: methionine--tRNA ligase subunit beta [Nanoarchaeota archaeon]|nr:methionine--tRNA ligase subunit beta [Nanoarchaeota archaeon]